jgi:hypothetical protein
VAVVESAALVVAQRVPEVQLPVPAQVPVLADLVVEAAVSVDLLNLLSRLSFSAAMAKSSP